MFLAVAEKRPTAIPRRQLLAELLEGAADGRSIRRRGSNEIRKFENRSIMERAIQSSQPDWINLPMNKCDLSFFGKQFR
ncbi:hypothetical protein [Mesorhizobium carmichaelinearum]|uniref:hypothetical protein n=1 Tax=Mesorhizobium carmichaelinearum TaxID=1208188 RepID=UPI00118101C2|nr:hypothetical protein [Mesorhizobium carmichaelinearum]